MDLPRVTKLELHLFSDRLRVHRYVLHKLTAGQECCRGCVHHALLRLSPRPLPARAGSLLVAAVKQS